jgi:hypothetical protein
LWDLERRRAAECGCFSLASKCTNCLSKREEISGDACGVEEWPAVGMFPGYRAHILENLNFTRASLRAPGAWAGIELNEDWPKQKIHGINIQGSNIPKN